MNKSTTRKWTERAALTILGTTAFLYFVPLFVPSVLLEYLIDRGIFNATGRHLILNGEISFRILPSPSVVVTRTGVTNQRGYLGPPILLVDQVDMTIRWLPLLRGRLDIAKFHLDRPELSLGMDSQGRGNWIFERPVAPASTHAEGFRLISSARAADTASPPSESRAESRLAGILSRLSIDDVSIDKGRIAFVPGNSLGNFAIGSITVHGAIDGPEKPISVSATIGTSNPLNLLAKLRDPLSLIAGHDTPISIKIGPGGAGMETDGGDLPDDADSIELTALARVDGRRASLENIHVRQGNNEGTGALSIDGATGRLAVSATLNLGQLSLDPFLRSFGSERRTENAGTLIGGLSPSKSDAFFRPWRTEILNLGKLRAAEIAITLTGGPIIVHGTEIGPIDLQLTMKDGVAAAQLAETTMGEGEIGFSIALAAKEPGAVSGSLDITVGKVGLDFVSASRNGTLRGGTIDAGLRLSVQGGTEADLVRSLTGAGRIEVRGATVALAGAVDRWGGAFGTCPAFVRDAELNMSFAAANGALKVETLAIRSPELAINGTGAVDLVDRRARIRIDGRPASCIKPSTIENKAVIPNTGVSHERR